MLDIYNTAAHSLTPPHQWLEWKAVIKYAFLADFDLLHDTCQDISHHTWVTPAGCLAMDLCYKISHAQEEIDWLDVKVHHVATYICVKDHYLNYMEEEGQMSNPHITHQIQLHHLVQGHFHSYNRHCLFNIA